MTGGTEGLSDQFQALRLFVQVARTGSFSKGARAMRLSQPTASRIIALLEEQLGTPLFSRSTRALILTDAGAAYLARIQPILASLEEADNAIRGGEDLHGSLRIGVSTILASRALVPLLGGFLTRHPNLQVELVTDDRRQDLIQEGIDVAVRIGRLPDSSAIARLVGRWPLVVAAAPRDPPELLPAAGRVLERREAKPCREVAALGKGLCGGASATIAVAAIGPMPGMVISLRATSSSRARFDRTGL